MAIHTATRFKGKTETAKALGVAPTTVDALRDAGMPAKRAGRGWQYCIEQCQLWKQGYDAGIRIAGRYADEGDTESHGETLQKEQLLKLKAERQLAEHKLRTAQGEWVQREEARQVFDRRL